jgi:hypothetical protein
MLASSLKYSPSLGTTTFGIACWRAFVARRSTNTETVLTLKKFIFVEKEKMEEKKERN